MESPEDYLRTTSESMRERYEGECLAHARKLHAILVAQERDAWIGRLRNIQKIGDAIFHGPLTPMRFRGRGGPTWTTHYVAGSGGLVYDPMVGWPIPVDVYATTVFGEQLEIERLTEGATAEAGLVRQRGPAPLANLGDEVVQRAVGAARIELLRADITTLEVDAIVNAANSQLTPGGAVGLAIHRAAGPELEAECMSLRRACMPGEAVITGAYRLAARYVIHAVGASWHGGNRSEAENLSRTYRSCFALAEDYGIRSIAFPAISCGLYSFPAPEAASIAVGETLEAIRRQPGLERVVFALLGDETFSAFEKALRDDRV